MKSPILALSIALALATSPFAQANSDDEHSCSAEEFADIDEGIVFAASQEESVEITNERQLQLCSNLESKLEQLQVLGFNIESDSFKLANKKLQENYNNVCESSTVTDAKIAEVERDMAELDESLNYLTIFVAKKRSGGGAPRILAPFKKRHDACAPGCGYVSWGIWGDRDHQRRASCHNSGDAIDIHAIRCGKTTHGPRTARFAKYVGCMKQTFGTVFGNAKHKNHVHIQLRDCRKIKGSLQGK